MPIDKYLILRKAVEIDEISNRLQLISDINAAFSGNRQHIQNLQKTFTQIMGQSNIRWEGDPDWKSRLSKYQR